MTKEQEQLVAQQPGTSTICGTKLTSIATNHELAKRERNRGSALLSSNRSATHSMLTIPTWHFQIDDHYNLRTPGSHASQKPFHQAMGHNRSPYIVAITKRYAKNRRKRIIPRECPKVAGNGTRRNPDTSERWKNTPGWSDYSVEWTEPRRLLVHSWRGDT